MRRYATGAFVPTGARQPTRFDGRYGPTGEVFESEPDSLENFLTERYCLYSADSRGRVSRGDIHHHMWPLQGAEADVETLDMTRQIGVELPETAPTLHLPPAASMWSPGLHDV